MRKITISGIEIEVDEACEVVIDGSRITVKAKPAQDVHHWHSVPQIVPIQPYVPTWPHQPWITWGINGSTSASAQMQVQQPDGCFSVGYQCAGMILDPQGYFTAQIQ